MEWKDELDKKLGQEGDSAALGLSGVDAHVHLFRNGQELPSQPRLCPGADSEDRGGRVWQLGWACSFVSQQFLPGSREGVAAERNSTAVVSATHGPVHGWGQLRPRSCTRLWSARPRFGPGLFHLHTEKPKV